MNNVLVAGLINLETTVRVDGFPIEYQPVLYPFGGVKSTVSGVGYNIAKALTTLGLSINFMSLVGYDSVGRFCRSEIEHEGIPVRNVLSTLHATPQSAILYDASGRRQINVDLKDVQEKSYPEDAFLPALENSDIAVLCNINWTRAYLAKAKELGKIIITDVHSIGNLNDDYDRDYMAHADILFMSHEKLPEPPREFARRVMDTYGNQMVIIGMGADGALLAMRNQEEIVHYPAVQTRPVVNTIGAGDALFSAFIYTYAQTRDPYLALKKATVFASWKIGVSGAADGFLSSSELDKLFTSP